MKTISIATRLGHTLKQGVGAPYPAPAGLRWQRVVYLGEPVVYLGGPVYALVEA